MESLDHDSVDNGLIGQESLLRSSLGDFEKTIIIEALKVSRGNKAKAARALGITERIMGLRVCKYGIDVKTFRTRR